MAPARQPVSSKRWKDAIGVSRTYRATCVQFTAARAGRGYAGNRPPGRIGQIGQMGGEKGLRSHGGLQRRELLAYMTYMTHVTHRTHMTHKTHE